MVLSVLETTNKEIKEKIKERGHQKDGVGVIQEGLHWEGEFEAC